MRMPKSDKTFRPMKFRSQSQFVDRKDKIPMLKQPSTFIPKLEFRSSSKESQE